MYSWRLTAQRCHPVAVRRLAAQRGISPAPSDSHGARVHMRGRLHVLALLQAAAPALALRSAGGHPLHSSSVTLKRRTLLPALLPLALPAAAHASTKSRTAGYEVQHSEREWLRLLSEDQYFVLRQGGTESPNSSPLVKEKRPGRFLCAGCATPLFDASQKFESGTGWPSFASALPAVETQQTSMMGAALLGAELRCGVCGGHLGDVFLDGMLFVGTAAALTGKRYCIDGAALLFEPADGGELVRGDPQTPKSAPELPSWLQSPKIGYPA